MKTPDTKFFRNLDQKVGEYRKLSFEFLEATRSIDSLTVKDLKYFASIATIIGSYRMTKDQLLRALKDVFETYKDAEVAEKIEAEQEETTALGERTEAKNQNPQKEIEPQKIIVCKDTGIKFNPTDYGVGNRTQLHPEIKEYKLAARDQGWYARYYEAVNFGFSNNYTLEQYPELFEKAKKGLSFEDKEESTAHVCHCIGRATTEPPVGITITTNVRPGWASGSLGKITPGSDRGEIETDYLRGDRSNLSRAGNGDITYYDVSEGYYRASSVVRSYEGDTFWFKLEDEDILYFDSEDELICEMWDISQEELNKMRNDKFKAVEESQVGTLPSLEGSVKQIAWAKKIRLEQLKKITARIKAIESYEPTNEEEVRVKKELTQRFKTDIETYRNIVSSKFWIETRYYNPISSDWKKEAEQYTDLEIQGE